MKPRAYKYWPDYARDAYDEREAIACDDNRVGPTEAVPWQIMQIATEAATRAIAEAQVMEDGA